MTPIKCTSCNSSEIHNGQCAYCGTRYELEQNKQLIFAGSSYVANPSAGSSMAFFAPIENYTAPVNTVPPRPAPNVTHYEEVAKKGIGEYLKEFLNG